MSGDADHYLVLELKPGSPMAEVKSQYRRLAKRYHPDLHGNDARSQEKFRRVNTAYEFLSDPARKAAYDARLSSPLPASNAAPPKAAPKASANQGTPLPSRPPTYTRTSRNPFDALLEVKASPSVWFGGTAFVVLILIGIGFCWENGVGDQEDHAGAAYAFSPSTSPSPLEPGGDSNPAESPSEMPFDPSVAVPAPVAEPRVSPVPRKIAGRTEPKISYTLPQFVPDAPAPKNIAPIPKNIVPPPKNIVPPPKNIVPTRELSAPLLARYQAAVPRIDRLINQGYAVCDADGNDGRTDPLKADLAKLTAVRDRVRPAIAHLPREAAPTVLRREVAPILADLSQLETHPQPVQKDIQALASAVAEAAPGDSVPSPQ